MINLLLSRSVRRLSFTGCMACLLCALFVMGPAHAQAPAKKAEGDTETKKKPDSKIVKLPGIVVNREKKYVDIEAKVALNQGLLEVIACTPDTKEHESLVVVKAKPSQIHVALLLLGLKNGNPMLVKFVGDEDNKRMVEIAPRGDRVVVSLVITEKGKKPVERSVSDFLKKAEDANDGNAPDKPKEKNKKAKAKDKFSNSFIFGGSQIVKRGKGERQYLADETGTVVSISTFGDEVLCLPTRQSTDNAALVWSVDSTYLPKKGTAVTLRLRPEAKAKTKDKAKDPVKEKGDDKGNAEPEKKPGQKAKQSPEQKPETQPKK